MAHRLLVLTASAGTGKTHQLSTRYLKLLFQQGDAPQVERILATTFTRKAAGEIFDRIVGRLVGSLTQAHGLVSLADSVDRPELDRAECLRCLQDLTRQLHRVRILTLDAFFAELALNFSLDLALPAHWQIADDSQAKRIRDQAIGRMLVELGGHAATKLVHQLAKGELKRDVDTLLDQAIQSLFDIFRAASDFGDSAWNWIKTIRPISETEHQALMTHLRQLLREGPPPGVKLGGALDKLVEFVANRQWLDAAQTTLIESSRVSGKFGRTVLPPHIRDVLNTVAHQTANELRSQLGGQNQATFMLLTAYLRHYCSVCQEQHLAFFSDITHALREYQHGHEILAYRLDGHIEHLLLDEFQDTSPDQWRIIRPVFARIQDRGEGTFFCVGDVKQAIYAWRHGSSEILEDLAKQLPAQRMDQTRRSYPAVVGLVNQVFRHLERHELVQSMDGKSDVIQRARADAISEWVSQFPGYSSHEPSLEREADGGVLTGYACLRSAPEPEKSETPLEKTQKYVAQLVAGMLAASPRHSIGVLVRTNDCVTQIIHQLRLRGINASEIGGNPLTNSAPARLILSLLRFADHPGHSAARYHLASSILGWELGYRSADSWRSQELLAFAHQLRRDLLHKGYGPTIAELSTRLSAHCTSLQRRRLRQLVDLAYLFQPRATPRPTDFLDFVEATRVPDPTTANVHVLTIHQAKGLEYDRVIVTELDKVFRPASYCYQRDPRSYAPRRIVGYVNQAAQRLLGADLTDLYYEDQRRDFREELCCLYVALTRARFELQLVVHPSAPNANKFSSTLAGLVGASLCDSVCIPPETIVAQMGEADWHRDSLAERPTACDVTMPTATTRADAICFKSAVAGPAFAPETSPSELEGESRLPVATLFSGTRQLSMQQGTLIHGWFEAIEWLEEEPPSDEQLQHIANGLGIPASEPQLREFRQTLLQPHVQRVLDRERYRAEAQAWLQSITDDRDLRFEVCNEQPILFASSQRVLRGYVDRLVLVWSGDRTIAADAIDFKTDEVDSADALQARGEFYAPQLAAYREAVAGMLRLDPGRVRARLLFTAADEIVPVW